MTNDVCEFLQKVPGTSQSQDAIVLLITLSQDTTENIFKLGSTNPASVLLDAVEQLEKKSPEADENIQLIRPNLPDAVASCVRAAGAEYSTHWQKQLLKAASFGKSVLDLYSSDDFVEMCEKLRVLNAVRDYRVGLPLSYEQYERLGSEKLIQRLMNRRDYLLAFRVSDYLRLPTHKIFIHWACEKVRHSTGDEDAIRDTVISRLAKKRGISFELIARAAYDEGRSHLATELLDHESRAGKQVPLLLSMSEDELALDKAIASGDTDLVFFVLLHLKKTLPLASFFRMLSNRPLATALVESSARDQDQPLLKDLYYQDDRRLDGADLLFSEALAQTAPQTKVDKLKLASKLVADNTKDATASLYHKSFQEAQALIRLQTALDNDLQAGEKAYTGLSLNATLHRLILASQGKRASKLASDFHVADRTFAWIRLRALVAKRNWQELEDIANKSRKSSIGWEPYYNEILGAGNTKLAGDVFVAKCTALTSRERSEMWVKCGMIASAAEELAKAKDVDALEELRGTASGSGVAEIDRMLRQLRPKR